MSGIGWDTYRYAMYGRQIITYQPTDVATSQQFSIFARLSAPATIVLEPGVPGMLLFELISELPAVRPGSAVPTLVSRVLESAHDGRWVWLSIVGAVVQTRVVHHLDQSKSSSHQPLQPDSSLIRYLRSLGLNHTLWRAIDALLMVMCHLACRASPN